MSTARSPDQFTALPLDEQLARDHEARIMQEAAFLEAVKKVHADEPTIELGDYLQWKRRIGKSIWISQNHLIKKVSPSGVFIGWYRKGQTRGKPNRRLPLEQDVDKCYRDYADQLSKLIPPAVRAAALGKQSGQARQQKGLELRIFHAYARLTTLAVPKSRRAKRIALDLNCNVDYVRRVLRRLPKP